MTAKQPIDDAPWTPAIFLAGVTGETETAVEAEELAGLVWVVHNSV